MILASFNNILMCLLFCLIISLSFYFPVYFYLVSVSFIICCYFKNMYYYLASTSISLLSNFLFQLFSPSLYFSVLCELSPEEEKNHNSGKGLCHTNSPTLTVSLIKSRLPSVPFFKYEETPEKLWSVSCNHIWCGSFTWINGCQS